MSGCFECDVDHHLACPFLGEDDDGFDANEDGWYSVHCCCGLAVDSRQTHEAESPTTPRSCAAAAGVSPPTPARTRGGAADD